MLSIEYSYGGDPEVTFAVISPSVEPKHEISCPLKLEVIVPATERIFGWVIVYEVTEFGSNEHELASVIAKVSVPAPKLLNEIVSEEIWLPSTK